MKTQIKDLEGIGTKRDLAKALQGAGLEGEGAEALVGAAKVLKAYKDALPENAYYSAGQVRWP